MKKMFLFLLPAVALAQQPATAPDLDPQLFYDQSKKVMLPMLEESLPLMHKARDCLQAASSESELKACGDIMTALQKQNLGHMAGGAPGEQRPPMQQPQKVEVTAENKENMLQFLKQSILIGSAMQECFGKSSGPQQMRECMLAKKPKP
jgi:hypothetical protein